LLVLLAVAILGPWTYERLYIPAEYACPAPNFRLEGDFCGSPLGLFQVCFWTVGGLVNLLVRLVSGAAVFAEVRQEALAVSLWTLVLGLLGLPFASSLASTLQGERRDRRGFHLAAWGLGAGAALLFGLSGEVRLARALWGAWLYFVLAAGALVLEALVLAARHPLGTLQGREDNS
jgi:hypothetical protein